MPALRQSFHAAASESFFDAIKAILDETLMLAEALLSPNKIIREVEQMRSLQVAADNIEATDPAQAEVLRSRAARIGLR
ncbi:MULTISPECIES: hypothetical protein [Variovorax]|uniref:hypothetical protein n=1 Tax=Variovorax TaxID=34072 RepID=UPI002858B0E2|nr:hypothetical protein [Variovorax sp. 3319]MDR6886696.1 hypothetical protein [Variovorax sp. 3319]